MTKLTWEDMELSEVTVVIENYLEVIRQTRKRFGRDEHGKTSMNLQ